MVKDAGRSTVSCALLLAPADDQILQKIVHNRHRYTDESLGNFR